MDWDGAAVTARRLVDLCCEGGDDDMFSTDLTTKQLQVGVATKAAVAAGVCACVHGHDDVLAQRRRTGQGRDGNAPGLTQACP